MQTYEFAYMTDERFAMPTAVSICSLCSQKSVDSIYNVHLILDNVSSVAKEKFSLLEENDVRIIFHETDGDQYEKIAKELFVAGIHVSRTDMLKFELPNFLEEQNEVLYLDGDIVINKCIESIFDTDISEMYLASVDDMGDKYDENGISNSARRIGVPQIRYFNAGMMYLNLRKMREDGIPEKLWRYRKEEANYFMSQDALNYVLRNGRVRLSYRYNFLGDVFSLLSFMEVNDSFYGGKYVSIQQCIEDQIVIHMAGRLKPWIYNMPWFSDLFNKYYINSPYGDKELNLISPIKKKNDEIANERETILWQIFINNIHKCENIVLYGSGARGRFLNKRNMEEGYCNIVLWVDRTGGSDDKVKPPEEICTIDYDRIVVAVSNEKAVEAIKSNLDHLSADLRKVIVIA